MEQPAHQVTPSRASQLITAHQSTLPATLPPVSHLQSPMDALRASPKKGSNALKRLGINVSEVRKRGTVLLGWLPVALLVGRVPALCAA